jgi:hypothetical protein
LKRRDPKNGSGESTLVYDGKSPVKEVLAPGSARLTLVKKVVQGREPAPALLNATAPPVRSENMLISGENIDALHSLIEKKKAGSIVNGDGTPGVRLIYIDPPFSSRQTYRTKKKKRAYEDRLAGADFIEFLRIRLILLRELLAENGSIYVHLDWKMAHHIKVIMDEVFGADNFLNDIIWHYGGRGAKAISSQFSRNHDIILLYRKETHLFNRLYTTKKVLPGSGVQRGADSRPFKTAPRGDYTDASVERLRAEGRVHTTKTGKIRIKYFLDETPEGVVDRKLVGDVWDDIPDAMHLGKSEKTGYVAIETTEERLSAIATSKGYENPKKKYGNVCGPYSVYKAQ